MVHIVGIWQHTINKDISFAGVGLHSGKPVRLVIKPAPVDSGIRFVRVDQNSEFTVHAHMSEVSDTSLATTLGNNESIVGTTEHLLAALAGLAIDNAVVELDSDEVPIMDGSAGPFVHLMQKVGRRRQEQPRLMLQINREISVKNGSSDITIKPHNGLKVSCEIDFDHEAIRRQSLSLEITPDSFAREIASARTFGFLHEVEYLRQNGKALGGSLENAVVIDKGGVVNVGGLRFSDEFVRHKALDLIGDLALLGCAVKGHVKASRCGHGQHLQLMQAIIDNHDCWQFVRAKEGDFDQKTVVKSVSSLIKPLLVSSRSASRPAAA